MVINISNYKNNSDLIKKIQSGALVVMPTDTVFGFITSAFSKNSVERLYEVRGRNLNKPCIILCSSLSDLPSLGIVLNEVESGILEKIWPNSVSVILNCPSKKFDYLHRGSGTLAVRIPKSLQLRAFLAKTGPVLAPSANLQGLPVAKNIREARKYFGNKVDVYVSGKSKEQVSTLVVIENGKVSVLREGAVDINKIKKLKNV